MKVGISTESVIGHAAALGRDLKSVLGEPLGEYTPEDLKLYLRKRFSDKIRTDMDRDAWGYLISFVGNRARWSATQCRFIVFETLAWLAQQAQVADYFSASAVLPNPSASARLKAYRGQAMAQNGYLGRSGPRLILGDPRTIGIHNTTRYPNVTQVRKTEIRRAICRKKLQCGILKIPPCLQNFCLSLSSSQLGVQPEGLLLGALSQR